MADCASALAALRQAEASWNAAYSELQAAQKAVQTTGQALAAAEKAFNAAALAADAALKAWSDFIDGLKKDPSFGVPGIEAGTAADATQVPSGASSGLVRDPTGAALILWGRSDMPAVRHAWATAMVNAEGTYNTLSSESKSASAAVPPAKAAFDQAKADDDAAHARLNAAVPAEQAAKDAYHGALAVARAACGSTPTPTPAGNGITVGVDPLVPSDRSKKLIGVIDLLKPKETSGLKVIQHYDHRENKDAFAVWDPTDNTVHLYDCCSNAAIIKHEVGHWVYHNKVADRQAWKDFWAANKSKMPSSIARDDDDQGFAECYERLRDNEKLDPAVKQAISDILDKIQ